MMWGECVWFVSICSVGGVYAWCVYLCVYGVCLCKCMICVSVGCVWYVGYMYGVLCMLCVWCMCLAYLYGGGVCLYGVCVCAIIRFS